MSITNEQSPASTREVRVLDEGDIPAMRSLFSEIFKHEMSEAFWAWKYRAYGGCAIGVFNDGELVAHYGGAGAPILYKGEPAQALQIVDLMVKPSARQAVRKQSPFVLASCMFLEQFVGYEKPYLLTFGFPSSRAMALSERMGIHAPVGRMVEISWTIDSTVKRPSLLHAFTGISPGNLSTHSRALAQLWQQQREQLHDYILLQKDAAYLEHRYLRNPSITYAVVLVTARLTGKPLGLLVLKTEPERVLLMDLIGPFAHFPLLLQIAKWHTRKLGRNLLVTWSSDAFVSKFADADATLLPLPIITPANIWTAAPAPADLLDRWWLMPGDTDFL